MAHHDVGRGSKESGRGLSSQISGMNYSAAQPPTKEGDMAKAEKESTEFAHRTGEFYSLCATVHSRQGR